MGIEVIPPCVNRGTATFSVDQGRLVYALGALKNVGVEAMKLVVEGRGAKPFATLYDFARRVDLKRVGKRPLEMLAAAGAFDQLDRNRARVFAGLDALVAYSAAVHEDTASAQVSLFGASGEDLPEPRLPASDDWLPMDRLAREHAAVGFYLSGHPLDDYGPALKRKGVLTLAEITQRATDGGAFVGRIAGSVANRQERKSARGNRFAFVGLSDPTGLYEVTVFSDVLETARPHLEAGCNVVLTVEATAEGETLKLLARAVQPIDMVVADAGATGLRIHLENETALPYLQSLLARIGSEGGRSRGPISFCITDMTTGREIDVTLPSPYPINPQIKGALKSLGGVLVVEEV